MPARRELTCGQMSAADAWVAAKADDDAAADRWRRKE
jgi:hypothetical protein